MGSGTSKCCLAPGDLHDEATHEPDCGIVVERGVEDDELPCTGDDIAPTTAATLNPPESSDPGAPREPPRELAAPSAEVLGRVQALVDGFHILEARALLAGLRQELCSRHTPEDAGEWDAIKSRPLVQQLLGYIREFERVGQTCCNTQLKWFSVYEDRAARQFIEGRFDPRDTRVFQYRLQVAIPSRLSRAFVVANEHELHPLWQPQLVAAPENLVPNVACHKVVHVNLSFMGGIYKVDNLNEIKRFVHTEGGLLVEYLQSVGEDHAMYRKPNPGYKRLSVDVRNIWAACGPALTLMIQVGTIRLPFSISKMLLQKLGSIMGKPVVKGLTQNSLLSSQPGSPWEKFLTEDRSGLYAMLQSCEESAASLGREDHFGKPGNSQSGFELSGMADYFRPPEL